jgi:hypothetical protein
MPYKEFNPDITPKSGFSISFWQVKKDAAAITPPVALVAGDITELADYTDSRGFDGDTFSFVATDVIKLAQVDLGVNQRGEVAFSAPSPTLDYAATGAGVGLRVALNFADGVVGKIILMQTADQSDMRAVGWYLRGTLEAVLFTKPSIEARTLAKFTEAGQTLYEVQEENFTPIINGASKEVLSRLNTREIQNAGQITEITSSTIQITGEIPKPSKGVEHALSTGGDIAIQSNGSKVGGSGYKRSACFPDRFMALKEGGDNCSSIYVTGFIGTFAQDTTSTAGDTGVTSFTASEQSYAPFKGIRPNAEYETA